MKNKMQKIKKILIGLLVVAALVLCIKLLCVEVTYMQGVDGIVTTRSLPLYLKLDSFLNRHFHYRYLASQITKNIESREEKIKVLMKWTRNNIKPQPQELPVIDDHPLHIIIRGYGVDEQVEDIFTLLCNYAGIPAYMATLKTIEPEKQRTFSFVYFEKQWRIVHAANQKIFLKNNSWATLKDFTTDPSLILGSEETISSRSSLTYQEFFSQFNGYESIHKTRHRKQTPLGRILQEFLDLF
ncbi:MAG: transglutaminase domain-containing protein [Deltaproteobacteria bacterium]|nr:transglutaminase domain-containing protein [Deltaproteobacteria bacterium]